jgi:hypothetical protein
LLIQKTNKQDSQYAQMTKLQEEKLKLQQDFQNPSVEKTNEYQTNIQRNEDEWNRVHYAYVNNSREFNQAFAFFRDSFVANVFGKLKMSREDVDTTINNIKQERITTKQTAIRQEMVHKQELARRKEIVAQNEAIEEQNVAARQAITKDIYNNQPIVLPPNVVKPSNEMTGQEVVTPNVVLPPHAYKDIGITALTGSVFIGKTQVVPDYLGTQHIQASQVTQTPQGQSQTTVKPDK